MSADQRDAWVRAYLEDVFNGHNLQSLDKYMTANLVVIGADALERNTKSRN